MGDGAQSDREAGLAIIAEQFSPAMAERLRSFTSTQPFGAEMGDLAMRNAYLALWLREGLNRRDRSLITVAMLVALGSHEELAIHAQIALENGCTVKELEELVYHATAYAGFPAASSGRMAIQQSFLAAGILDKD
jgi:4-carboxymuconolactone decarboxylase